MSDPAGQMGQAVKGLMGSLGDAGMTQPPGYPGGSGGSEEGPMLGGLLDMLMKIGQVKNLF